MTELELRFWAGANDARTGGAFGPFLRGTAGFEPCAVRAIEALLERLAAADVAEVDGWIAAQRRAHGVVPAGAGVALLAPDPPPPSAAEALLARAREGCGAFAEEAAELAARLRALARATLPLEQTREVRVAGLATASETNARDWKARNRRARAAAERVGAALAATGAPPPLPVLVTITRVAPHELDSDNLVSSNKHVRDSAAAYLGVDDRDRRLTFRHRQRAEGPRERAVIVRIEPRVRGEELEP